METNLNTNLDFIEQELLNLQSKTQNLIKTYVYTNDTVKQQSREILDSTIAISTLRTNLDNTQDIKNSILILEENLKNKNQKNKETIESFLSVKSDLENTHSNMRKLIKLLLEINDSIYLSLENSKDKLMLEQENEEDVINARKLCYSNIIDNHDLRVEPPIFGVKKTDIGLSGEFNGRSSPTSISVPFFSDSSLGSATIPQSVLDEIEKKVNEEIDLFKLSAKKSSKKISEKN